MSLFDLLPITWEFSVFYGKFAVLLILLFTIYQNKDIHFSEIIQRHFTKQLIIRGEFLIYGFILGGISIYLFNNFILASIIFLLIFIFGFTIKKETDLPDFGKIKKTILLSVIILGIIFSFSAIFSDILLLNSLSALFIYGILFWKI